MKISFSSAGGITKVLIKVVDMGPYNLHDELWTMPGTGGNPDGSDLTTPMRQAYTKTGEYIGDPKTANMLCHKYGIEPELAQPDHSVCSIGYSKRLGKWFGWSHRAIFGFRPGDTCKEGDSGYTPEIGEWTARTESDARRMAKTFASSVSSGDSRRLIGDLYALPDTPTLPIITFI